MMSLLKLMSARFRFNFDALQSKVMPYRLRPSKEVGDLIDE